MGVTDFLSHGRKFFGFLIPGGLLVSAGLVLLDEQPFALFESGNGLARGIAFLTISYIVGYCTQATLFALIVDLLRNPEDRDEVNRAIATVEPLLKSKLPIRTEPWPISRDQNTRTL